MRWSVSPEMRRRHQRHALDLWLYVDPVIHRDMRPEAPQLTLADGSICQAMEPREIRAAVTRLRAAAASCWELRGA